MGYTAVILASVIWGITYAAMPLVFRYVSVAGSVIFTAIFEIVILGGLMLLTKTPFFLDRSILHSKQIILLIVFYLLIVLANFAISFGIKETNATVASLIEISYPIFVVLISIFLFGEGHLSLPIIIGGVLIFAGVITIILSRHG